MRILAVTAAAMAFASATHAETPAQAVAAFRTALAAGDGPAATALLADEATVYEEGHVEASKAEYVAAHLPADLAFARATTFEIARQHSGDSGELAYVTTEGRTRGDFHGQAVDSISTETMVLRRQGEAWKIIHIHWSARSAD